MRPVHKITVTQYNKDDYDVMRRYLFDQIGSYCSYCEQPISNDSAVEHKVPKSGQTGFPDFATQWRNLLLACFSCNSVKGHLQPSRLAVPQPPSQEQWYEATAHQWVWPDRLDAKPGDETYLLFEYFRQSLSQTQLIAQGLVRKPKSRAPSKTPYDRTWIRPNDNYIKTDAALRRRVVETIVGLNLNVYEPTDPRYSNRRVDNRDTAFHSAQAAIARLEKVWKATVLPSPGLPPIRLLVRAMRETAISMGFWSVWFWVFRGVLDNPKTGSFWHGVSKANREELLLRTLLFYYPDERNHVATVPLLPGTDASRLHLGSFT